MDPLPAPAPPSELAPQTTGTVARPRVWTVFVAFALALVLLFAAQIGTLVLSAIAQAVRIGRTQGGFDSTSVGPLVASLRDSPSVLLPALTAAELALLGLTLLLAAASPLPWRQRLGLSGPRPAAAVLLVAPLATLAASFGLDALVASFGLNTQGSMARMQQFFADASVAQVAAALLLIGGLAATTEELFFRGYLQTRLSARWGSWPAIVIASLLFGLIHADPVHTPVAFAMGLLLGWMAERTRSLRASVVSHVANNCSAVLLARLFPRMEPGAAAWLSLGLSLAVFAGALVLLRGLLGPAAAVPAVSKEAAGA